MAPDSLLRESCDPPPASSKSRRSRFRTRKTRRGRRRRRGQNRIDRRAERNARRNASKRRFYYRAFANFVNGGRGNDGASRRLRIETRRLKNRRFRDAVFKIFEFRGEFVLLDFVVHRFFANAEFARGESTTAVASDERFEESEPFDLRQRQSGEAERRRRRNVGATGRAKRNGKRTRRLDGSRKGNVGDRNARFVGACVARKTVNRAGRSDRNGSGASNGWRGEVGRRRGEGVASERRLGGRNVSARKTVEGIHRNRRKAGGAGKRGNEREIVGTKNRLIYSPCLL